MLIDPREQRTNAGSGILAANIDFFDIRLSDLIDQPTRNGQAADGVGSAKGIQARWRGLGRREGPRGPYPGPIG